MKSFWKCKSSQSKVSQARKPDVIIINRKKAILLNSRFCRQAYHRVKMKNADKLSKYIEFAGQLKGNTEHEEDRYQ